MIRALRIILHNMRIQSYIDYDIIAHEILSHTQLNDNWQPEQIEDFRAEISQPTAIMTEKSSPTVVILADIND
jgi:hypothetical protein